MRVLIVGWPSFLRGEATVGDMLSIQHVRSVVAAAGIAVDVALSPGFRPGGLSLEDVDPSRYSHLLFVCGPAHGDQVRALHDRFVTCRRIAVGVSVIDPADAAVTGFHRVLARDEPRRPAARDLSARAHTGDVPVVGVTLAPGQREYGASRRHEEVHRRLLGWLGARDCARVELDTRLAVDDWRHCATADQFASVLRRMDLVVTTRLHGLVLALRHGVPALAIDPVAGGGKVRAQAQAWHWPAILTTEDLLGSGSSDQVLTRWWDWCRSPLARWLVGRVGRDRSEWLTSGLLRELRPGVAEPAS